MCIHATFMLWISGFWAMCGSLILKKWNSAGRNWALYGGLSRFTKIVRRANGLGCAGEAGEMEILKKFPQIAVPVEFEDNFDKAVSKKCTPKTRKRTVNQKR